MNATRTTRLNGLTFAINDMFLAHLIRLYKAFDGDLESCIVLGEIAHYNTCHLFPDKSTRKHDLNEVHKTFKGCNAHSISLSSGIPRETVRRKIKKLMGIGYLTLNEKKQLIITQKPAKELGEFSKETLHKFMDFIEELRSDRLI